MYGENVFAILNHKPNCVFKDQDFVAAVNTLY